jgi:hypothetical protein
MTFPSAFVAIVLAGAVSVSAVHPAAQTDAPDPLAAVKVSDPDLRRLIVETHERSATFRGLVEEIESSGWLVFVHEGRCPNRAAVGCLLHVVGTYEGAPYLRVVVSHLARHPKEVMATVAHELQHVVETTQAGDVTDAESMRALFARIGTVSMRTEMVTTYETEAARKVGDQVRRELSR